MQRSVPPITLAFMPHLATRACDRASIGRRCRMLMIRVAKGWCGVRLQSKAASLLDKFAGGAVVHDSTRGSYSLGLAPFPIPSLIPAHHPLESFLSLFSSDNEPRGSFPACIEHVERNFQKDHDHRVGRGGTGTVAGRTCQCVRPSPRTRAQLQSSQYLRSRRDHGEHLDRAGWQCGDGVE